MPFTSLVSGGTAQALISLGDREGHQVSPVLQSHLCSICSRDCSGICWSQRARIVTGLKCLTSFSRSLYNSFSLCSCLLSIFLLLLLLLCFGDVTATEAPAACHLWRCKSSEGESLTPANLWSACVLPAAQVCAFGCLAQLGFWEAHDTNYFQPLTWDIWTSLGILDTHISQCLISSVLEQICMSQWQYVIQSQVERKKLNSVRFVYSVSGQGRRLPLGSFSFIGVQLQLQSNNKNSPTLKKSN